MSVDFRLPNITAATPEGQIQQMQSYLYQLVNQLSWALDHIEVGSTVAQPEEQVSSPTRVFKSIKSLIMRDEDITVSNLNRAYPVGAIYVSVSDANPAALFGFGTWEQIKDRFLLSAGDTYEAGAVGGEAEHTLTVDEMPSHKHNLLGEYGAVSGEMYEPWSEYTQLATPASGTQKSSNASMKTTGGSKAHNNMPPYLTVYVWKRTA